LRRLVDAQEEEQQRIARDIHDDPLQALAVLAMNLDMASRRAADPQLLAQLAAARESVSASIASLRSLIFKLRPRVLESDGLIRALEVELEQLRQETGLEGSVTGTDSSVPLAISVNAYRIAREALANIRKHARATHVDVRVTRGPSDLRVQIADDGCGLDGTATFDGHLGLVSMRERAEMAGGSFTIDSRPGKGTAIEFLLPLAGE
jgi:signal transduction histidine kinase